MMDKNNNNGPYSAFSAAPGGQPLFAAANTSDVYGTNNLLVQGEYGLNEADPFGLNASMHFETPFSYEQSNVRR